MISLRPYQEKAVEEIRRAFRTRSKRVLFVLPTGGGKTVVFCFIAKSVIQKKYKRAVILVHRQELVDQVCASLTAMDVPFGVIAAGYDATDAMVQVASVQTLARRLGKGLPTFDLVVTDECHHAVADQWRTIMQAMPEAYSLGVSATPIRADGRGLAASFDVMVLGPTVAELIAARHLVVARVFAPPQDLDLTGVRIRAGDYDAGDLGRLMTADALIGNVIEHYKRLAAGRAAVAFCANIEHSKLVAQRFLDAGISAAHVDGKTHPNERRRLISALGTGELTVLCNAGLVSEGVDVPEIGCAILMRPTQSVGLHLQQVGRALRLSPSKSDAIILDHAGNTARHGLPDAARTWTLADHLPSRTRGRIETPGDRLRRCLECGGLHPARTPVCATCGSELKPTPVEAREIAAELKKQRRERYLRTAEKIRLMSYKDKLKWANTPERVKFVAEVMNYKQGWKIYQLKSLEHGR